MSKNKLLNIGLILTIVCQLGIAQQETLYTQYVYNELTINPAYAGYHEALNISLNGRKQWIGLNGSPFITTVAAHTQLEQKSECSKTISSRHNYRGHRNLTNKTGLGLLVFNDRIGVDNTLQANFSYSHKIMFRENRLSFGLQGSVINYTQNFSRIEHSNSDDPVFNKNTKKNMLNFGSGIFFDNHRYYLGFSVPQIMEIYLGNSKNNNSRQTRQYFITGGYLFYINRFYKFKPSFMSRFSTNIPYQLDINAMLIYQDKIFAGISYRNKDTFSAIFQLRYKQILRMGLAYDYTYNKVKVATNGNVEVMLNYTLNKSVHKIVSPRYF